VNSTTWHLRSRKRKWDVEQGVEEKWLSWRTENMIRSVRDPCEREKNALPLPQLHEEAIIGNPKTVS
jgi:hypothetical protein